jgi:hypothetical protein
LGKSLDIYEQSSRTKTLFIWKLRTDESQGMLAVVHAEYFVIQFAIKMCKDQGMQKGNFACHFEWACTLGFYTWREKQAESVREQNAKKNICTQVGQGNREMEKTTHRGVYDLYYSPNIIPVINQ